MDFFISQENSALNFCKTINRFFRYCFYKSNWTSQLLVDILRNGDAQCECISRGFIISALKRFANNFSQRPDIYFTDKMIIYKSYKCQKIDNNSESKKISLVCG